MPSISLYVLELLAFGQVGEAHGVLTSWGDANPYDVSISYHLMFNSDILLLKALSVLWRIRGFSGEFRPVHRWRDVRTGRMHGTYRLKVRIGGYRRTIKHKDFTDVLLNAQNKRAFGCYCLVQVHHLIYRLMR